MTSCSRHTPRNGDESLRAVEHDCGQGRGLCSESSNLSGRRSQRGAESAPVLHLRQILTHHAYARTKCIVTCVASDSAKGTFTSGWIALYVWLAFSMTKSAQSRERSAISLASAAGTLSSLPP